MIEGVAAAVGEHAGQVAGTFGWVSRVLRRLRWCYIQQERSEHRIRIKSESHVRVNKKCTRVAREYHYDLPVIAYDTWAKTFPWCPWPWLSPIEMRIERHRDSRRRNLSVYTICSPVREVPNFKMPTDIRAVHPDLKSAKKAAKEVVRRMRDCPGEGQAELAQRHDLMQSYSKHPAYDVIRETQQAERTDGSVR